MTGRRVTEGGYPGAGGEGRLGGGRGRRSPPSAYGIAILLSALALAAQSLLDSWTGAVAGPFLLVYPTVLFIGWLGGRWPGVLATFLCGLAGWYLFLPPHHSFSTPEPADLL